MVFRFSLRRIQTLPLTVMVASLGLASAACESGGVGDPCIPEDEYRTSFPGFSETETNVESRSFQCKTRVCLATGFRGRVTCPYGQPADPNNPSQAAPSSPGGQRCLIPGAPIDAVDPPGTGGLVIDVPVNPQLVKRGPNEGVYCSCRCDGPDPNARYCDCPSGFECRELIDDLGLGSGQLAGSYCIREGTFVDNPERLANEQPCDFVGRNCGDEVHPGSP